MSPANEARVWDWIASLCDNVDINGTWLGRRTGPGLTCLGLCNVLSHLAAGSITRDDQTQLREHLYRHRPYGEFGFWWSLTRRGYKARARVCRKPAAEARSHI